ncbi:hypothetical protein KQX54_003679 [Cotesia glomerata]|uniref:Uncharacterized protein n=1 Tax=Cotesia glomerata TaxID=32391 RepID=A0AAV7HX07_COTGL|nr:hypothetical protein KQX54_003679 [Cotesia glomerata]
MKKRSDRNRKGRSWLGWVRMSDIPAQQFSCKALKSDGMRLDDWIRVIAVKRKSWQVRRMSTQLRVDIDSRTGMGMSATRSTSYERAEGG